MRSPNRLKLRRSLQYTVVDCCARYNTSTVIVAAVGAKRRACKSSGTASASDDVSVGDVEAPICFKLCTHLQYAAIDPHTKFERLNIDVAAVRAKRRACKSPGTASGHVTVGVGERRATDPPQRHTRARTKCYDAIRLTRVSKTPPRCRRKRLQKSWHTLRSVGGCLRWQQRAGKSNNYPNVSRDVVSTSSAVVAAAVALLAVDRSFVRQNRIISITSA